MHVNNCRGDERVGALRSSERNTRAVAVMVGGAGGRTGASYVGSGDSAGPIPKILPA